MKHAYGVLPFFLSIMGLVLLAGTPAVAAGATVSGVIKDASKQVVAKATVYLIPAADVEAMAKTAMEVKKNAANDEPMDDSLAANKEKYKQGISDKQGNFKVTDVADAKYFFYVVPADATYLPGGDKANTALAPADLKGKKIEILLSGNIPADAKFVGMTSCLKCHKAYGTEKMTLHKLGIRVAGNDFMEGSNTNDESALFCAEAEKAGVDAVNVTGGWHETAVPQLTASVPPGAYAYRARGLKEKVSVPVFASNRLGDPDVTNDPNWP